MIREHIESERQLTIHICSGIILKQELIDDVKALYDSVTTPNHLWDIIDADFSQITGVDLEGVAKFAKQYAPTRIGGRTAFVTTTDLGFGLARMYEVFAEQVGQRVEIRVFRSRKKAEKWLSAVSGG